MKKNKILSILLVLLLITGCFGSVITANAASAWSFRTGSGKRVAVGDIIELDKNEFQNFNLYKNGAEITQKDKTYKVRWSSSNETVLWIDPSNGKARGDKFATMTEDVGIATVTATINNVKTGAVANRSFIVRVGEEKTNNIIPTEAPKPDTPEAVAPEVQEPAVTVSQTKLDAIEVTFDDKAIAKAILNDYSLLDIYYKLGSNKITADVFEITQKKNDENTLEVTFLSTLKENKEYQLEYTKKSSVKTTFTTSDTVPYQITFAALRVEMEKETSMPIKIFNEAGVEITDYVTNAVDYEPVGNYDYDVFYITGNKINFYEAGKSVQVRASLDMGYDNDGNEKKDLTATARITSTEKAKPTYTAVGTYAVDSASYSSSPDALNYTSALPTLFVGQDDLSLYVKINYTEDDETEVGYVAQGTDTFGNSGYSYYVVGQAGIVLVNSATGEIIPVYEGSTTISVVDANNKGIARIPVTVVKEQKVASFTISNQSSSKLSVNSLDTDQFTFSTEVKDQVGNVITNNSDVLYTYEITSPSDNPGFDALFNVDESNRGAITISPTSYMSSFIAAGSTKQFTISVKASLNESSITKPVKVTVKNVSGVAVAKTELVVSKSTVDMKLTKDSVESYDVAIYVENQDSSGYLISYEPITLISSASEAATAGTDYSLLITKSGSDEMEVDIDITSEGVVFKPVTGGSYGSEIEKAKVGNYQVKLYKKNSSGSGATQKTSKAITVTDTTQSITASVTSTRINELDYDTLKEVIQFKRGTTVINDYIKIVDINETTVNNTCRIQSVTVEVLAYETNKAWKNSEYTEQVVTVGKTFIIN